MPAWARERRAEIVERLPTVFKRSQIHFDAGLGAVTARQWLSSVVVLVRLRPVGRERPAYVSRRRRTVAAVFLDRARQPRGLGKHPELVLAFYNERRAKAWAAQPNAAHLAIASLEQDFDVVVITQNVDNLHERAGSTNVLHVHGELAFARGTGPFAQATIASTARPSSSGRNARKVRSCAPTSCGSAKRPSTWTKPREHVAAADKVLVVGTSLTVYPAAGAGRIRASGRGEEF